MKFKTIVLLSICLIVFAGCKSGDSRRAPNVLLITVDTLRADYLGCYGSPDVKTGNIDRLASSGTLFARHVAASQCTNPSHATIMTGLYPSVHRMMNNEVPLTADALTLAEVFKTAGYSTLGAVSAGHLNGKHSRFNQGFDVYLDCTKVELKAGERNELFLSELEKIRKKPFFAWIHYFDPHGDYKPPSPYDKKYPVLLKFNPVPSHSAMDISKEKKAREVDPDEIIPLYKGEITYLDFHIGQLIRFLEKNKLIKNTLIVFTADHGESMVEKGIYFCHAGMYNPVIHVPLILSQPGKIPAGILVTSTTGHIDIFPTIIRLAGIAHPMDHIAGKSLVPTFKNPGIDLHDFVVSEAVNGVIRTVYQGGYKYIKPYPSDWACPEPYLYQAWDDYSEVKDLKGNDPERLQNMESLLEEWLKDAQKNALEVTENQKLDPKTKKVLETLGYIE